MTDQEQFQQLYSAMQRITRDYMSPAELRRHAQHQYGLPYHEALEMAYENIQAEAKAALKGISRPTQGAPRGDTP